MGSREEELDACWKLIKKEDGTEYYENICKKKTVLLRAGGTGIVGPKFKVEISGPEKDVKEFVDLFFERIKGYRA